MRGSHISLYRVILLAFVLGLLGVTKVWAEQFVVNHLRYSTTGTNTVSCIGHEFSSDEAAGYLIIPGSVYYNGKYWTVTAVGGFSGYTRLTGVSMPNSVTSIGNYAFSGCTGFSGNLNLPTSLTSIGIESFWGCTGFTGTLTIPESVTNIDITAFAGTRFSTVYWNAVNCNDITCGYTYFYGYYIYNSTHYYGLLASCSNLKYVYVGSNVQRLPAYSLYGCSQVTTLASQAETPPAAGDYVFNGVNTSINVKVPCGKSSAYQSAQGWSVFSIVEGDECEYLITGLADPAYAGTVSGSGTYNNGASCTLTANPNAGYKFIVWTETGTQVSTEASYTFTARNDRLLVAHFQQQIYTINVSHFPSAGGSVTGGGTFTYGNSCTVTATPNSGFHFVNWTENGTQVSTDATYTFNVTDSRDLVANFVLDNIGSEQIVFADANVKAVCVANWDTNGDGEFSYDEAAAVTNIGTEFEKNTAITSFDELQYFTGLTSLYGGFTHKIVLNQMITIPYGAFLGCTNLTTVTIPNSVTLLKPCVFMNCSSLPTIDIPQAVTSIEDEVFYGCTGLTSLTVNSNTPPTLGSLVFKNVDKSIPVNVPCATVNEYMTASGWNEFTNYQGIDCVYHQIYATADPAEGGTVMGAGSYLQGTSCTLTAVAYTGYAFVNWTENGTMVSTNASYTFNVTGERTIVANFNQVNLDDIINFADANVKTICIANWDTNGDGELSYEEAAAVTSLGDVFAKNTTITTFDELQYFTGLTSIHGYYAFVPAGSNTMMEQSFGAFVKCKNLTSIVIPNTITSLYCAFNGCESLTSLEIPSEVREIGRGTFCCCYSLTSIEIPNSVTSIEREAFYECTGLTTLDIGSSVTTIGNRVFYGCSNLASMIVRALTPPSLGTNVFDNVVKTIPLSVYNVALDTYQTASGWSEFTNYQGMECIYHQINASANPTEGGTVTGAGTCIEGTGCVLTAINNPGYYFVNWTENGTVISTNVTYTVNVTGERVLVANFIQTNPNEIISFADDNVRSICVSHWDTNGDSELSYDEAASVTDLGLAFKNKTNLVSFDEFQYFIGLTALGPNTSKGGSTPHVPITPPIISTIYGEFYNCQNLTSIVLPNNLTSIGNIAFKECYSLISIEISSHVAVIYKQAFYNCSGLTSITVSAETPPLLGEDVFYNVNKSIPVYVPVGKVADYQVASGWSEFTNIQEIPIPDYEIEATANPADGGTITGNGIYSQGSNCTLTATANFGYIFNYWTENGNQVSTNAEYTFEVTGPRNLVANFVFDDYDINATANPDEGGAVTGDGTYINGTSCTLTATANEGYTFVNWTENGNEVSTDTEYTFTVNGNRALVANFSINNYEIEATANPTEGGLVIGADVYNHGSNCTLMAIANEGYSFVNWTENGNEVSTDAEYTFTVTGDRVLVANFSINNYEIAATANPVDSGIIIGAGTYNYGTDCTLIASANDGYTFVNWTENSNHVSTEAEYTFTVTEDRNLVANYSLNIYSIMATANPLVGGTVNGGGVYYHGTNCTLTATANDGYTFVNWTENGNEVSTSAEYTFTVNGNRALVANFSINNYEIEATANPTIAGIVTGGGNYYKGVECTLNAVANEGYMFESWTENGVFVSDNPEYTFTVNEDRTLEANFISTQTTQLSSGWNWWSTYIEMDGFNGLEYLENTVGDLGICIKSQVCAVVNYFPATGESFWFGDDIVIDNENCYMIDVTDDCLVQLDGDKANPADHPIRIKPNWSWIGYIDNVTQSANTAMSDFEPIQEDVIKSKDDAATYWAGYGWYPAINLVPGQGYKYFSNSNEDRYLVYNNASSKSEVAKRQEKFWHYDTHSYANTMTIISVVDIDNEEVAKGDYELAAFVDNECRGSVKLDYFEPLDRYFAVMSIAGNDLEEISFGLADTSNGDAGFNCEQSMTFATDAVVGRLSSPYIISFNHENTDAVVNIYPNPVDKNVSFTFDIPSSETISEMLIVNSLGAEVMHKTGMTGKVVKGLPVSGIYSIQVITNTGNVYRGKLVVK